MDDRYDVIVIGAGIVGLAHAYAAASRGLRVCVVERDAQCVGASIRNFGFITVTGQRAGDTWRRARRSRDVWHQLAPQAGISVEHRGLYLIAQRPAAVAVLEAFMRTDMAERCELHRADDAASSLPALSPALRIDAAQALLYSPHELRVESRTAIPMLAAWLAQAHGVVFHWGEAVIEAAAPLVRTTGRLLRGERIVICPGADYRALLGRRFDGRGLRLTQLQMLRVRPEAGFKLPGSVMSDLSLVRYAGYAALPEAQALRAELEEDEAQSLAHGIHLIVVQSADGSLVVGDSHHDGDASGPGQPPDSPLPFASAEVEGLILRQLNQTLNLEEAQVVERWTGVYPSDTGDDCLIDAPDSQTRIVIVTSGTGASTAFGIAEDVFAAW